jgi:hypothetical protein
MRLAAVPDSGPHDPRRPAVAPLDRRDVILAVGIATAAVVAFLPIHMRWFSLLDEGYVLAIADEMNRGRVLYRDIWIDNPFPGSFALLALWFRLAGTSIASSRLLTLAGFAVYATALYWIARALLPRRAALGFAAFVIAWRVWAFPHWQIYGYSLPAAAAVALAAAVTMAAWRRGARRLWFAAGVLLGVTTLCKQNYGFAVAATTGAVLLVAPFLAPPGRPRARDVLVPPLLVAGGLCATLVPVLAWLAAQGALDDFFHQAVVQPLRGAVGFEGYVRLPALWPLHRQDPALRAGIGSYFPAIVATVWWPSISTSWLLRETPVWDAGLKLVFWAPILVFFAAALGWAGAAVRDLVRRRVDAAHGPRLIALALAAGFLAAFPPPRDWTHLMMIVPPQALLGAALLHGLAARLPRAGARVLRAACWAALVLLLAVTAALVRDFRRLMDYPLDVPRSGVLIDRQNGPVLTDLLAHIERTVPPGAPLPVYPVQPMIGVLAGREPVAGFPVIWPVQGSERDGRIIAGLERERPPVVVYGLSQYAHLGRFEDNAPRLFEYLVTHYTIERVFAHEVFGPLIVTLTRRDDPAHDERAAALPALARIAGARMDRWPFAEVLAVPVGGPGRVRWARAHVDLPRGGGRLALAYGVNPGRWLGLGAGPFTFRVAAASARGGAPRILLRETIDLGATSATVAGTRHAPLAGFEGRSTLFAVDASGPAEARGARGLRGAASPAAVSVASRRF